MRFRSGIGYIAVMFMVVAILFVTGCEQPSSEIPAAKEGTVILTATEDKALVTDVNSLVTEYMYKATPRFSGSATGAVSEWSHLSYGGQGTVGLLTQGKWYFELRGLNSSGTIITTGSVEAYIDAGKENIIEVQMHTNPDIGLGSASYAVWTQNVSETGTVLKVYERPVGGTGWTSIAEHSGNASENVRFTGSAKNLTAGYHDMLFLLFDASGAVLGGEQVGIQVVAAHNTSVSGIIEPAAEIGLDLTIKSMGYVHGLLDPTSGILVEGEGRDRVAYMERGDTVTFSWIDQDDASSIPTEWIWAFDGEVVSETGKSYTVSFDDYGEHELSVIGIRRDAEGKAWDAGSAVIRIVVVRHICEITFLANGGFYSDGTDVYVISEDTTQPETREVPGGQPYDGLSPQRTGYVLTGWMDPSTGETVASVAKDGTVTFHDSFVTKKDTRTLKAIWVPGRYTLTVVWGENVTAGGKSVPYSSTYQIACGDPLSMLDSSASRKGFIFHGYTTEENARGEAIDNGDKYAWGRDVTLYANWEYIPIHVGFYKSYSDYLEGKNPYKYIEVGSDLRYGSLPQPLRQGKVFKGWAQPEDIDGTQYETVDGNKYLTNDALKNGKTFVEVDSIVRKYEDHVLVSVWGEGTIKISFDYANAALTSTGQTSINQFARDSTGTYYKYGALGTMYGALPFTGIETKVRDGWEFMGWYDSPSYSMRVYEVSAVTSMEDHTLYAKWEGKRINISFSTGTSETFPTKEVRYNAPYGTLPEPTRPGYTFEGWWYNGQEIKADTYVEAGSSHTLTAKWTAKTSTLTLNPNGGTWSWPTEMTLKYDDTYAQAYSGSVMFGDNATSDKLKNPTRYGYDFAGWYNNPAGSGDRFKGTTVNRLYEPQGLHAVWTAHRHKITFVYNWPGTTEEPSTTVSDEIAFGTSYGSLPVPKYIGYTFNGWYTQSTGGEQVSTSTKYLEDNDISLYGRWSILRINVSFYDGGEVCRDEGGNPLQPKTVTWGETYGTLPTPYKKGYRHTGMWQIVGQTDESGNPIYVNSSTRVTQLTDVTLTPVWEPLKIFIAIPFEAEVTESGTVTEADWSKSAYRNVTYGKGLETMRGVSISSGTWSDTGSASTAPSWSKTGYFQEGWKLVVPGVSVTEANLTTMLWDYAKADAIIKEKVGNLNPDQMIWLIPNWKPEQYQVSFVARLYSSTGITNTSSAPTVTSRMATYMENLGSVMGTREESEWTNEWSGYMCTGFYKDAALTERVTADSVFGRDITATKGVCTIYVKWMKIRTQYTYSTDSETLYPAGSTAVLYKYSDMFAGSNAGQVNGTPGWYSFTGHVDDVNYPNGYVRVGGNDITLLSLSKDVYNTSASASWTAPTDMEINIATYSAPYFTYTLTCSSCGGKGYRSLTKYHEVTEESKSDPPYYEMTDAKGVTYYVYGGMKTTTKWTYYTEYTSYEATNMPDGCPFSNGKGCSPWSSAIFYTMTCPNCKGNPSSVGRDYWVEEEYPSGCNEDCPEGCTEDHGTYTVLEHHVEYCKCTDTSWYNYYTPGTIRLQKGSFLGTEYGELNIYVNGVLVASNGGATRNAYDRCLSADMPSGSFDWDHADSSDTCHYDTSYWSQWLDWREGWCSRCEGKRAILRNGNTYHSTSTLLTNAASGIATPSGFYVKEGDVVTVEMSLKAIRSDSYITPTSYAGSVVLKDIDSQFAKITLAGAGDGVPRATNYDNYVPSGGKYMTTGANSVTSAPGTVYKSYAGFMEEKKWATTNLPGASDEPVVTELPDIGTITAGDIDKTRPATVSYTDAAGNSVSGTLGASGTGVLWTNGMLQVTFTPNSGSGTSTFTYDARQYKSTADNPVRNLNLSFWLKE